MFRILSLIVAFVTAVPVQATPLADAPSVRLVHDRFEAGTVLEGRVIEHTFRIENQGEASLVIEDIRASCSCSTSSFDKTVAPGESGRIELTTDSPHKPILHIGVFGRILPAGKG